MKAQAFLFSILPLTLAACGGGGGSDTSPLGIDPRDTARTFAATDGDFGDVITADETLTARQAAEAAMNLYYGTGVTEVTDATVAIERNGGGELTLIVNGVAHPFTSGDRDGDQVYQAQFGLNDRIGFMRVFGGTVLDDLLANGNGYAEVILYQTGFANDGDPDIRGYAVIGTEMLDADVGTLGSATYTGFARMDVVPTTGFVDIDPSNSILIGDLGMTINLDSTEISGLIDNIEVTAPGGTPTIVTGTVTMEAAEFDVNAFGGALTADADLITNVPIITDSDVGTYSGAFFGPNGEEIGGGLSFQDADYTGAGFFYGTKD